MKEDESFDPLCVGFFGLETQVSDASNGANLIQQFR
jgi:hypothetical protein